jgi:hypothetical protein
MTWKQSFGPGAFGSLTSGAAQSQSTIVGTSYAGRAGSYVRQGIIDAYYNKVMRKVDFLRPGSGLTVNLLAATTPLVVTFANGLASNGEAADFIGTIDSNIQNAWSAIQSNDTSYLYVDRNADGSLTLGSTKFAPFYGTDPSGSYVTTVSPDTTPILTANNAPSPYVAVGSTETGGSEAYKAFDAAGTTTRWLATAQAATLSLDFGPAGNDWRVITSYDFVQNAIGNQSGYPKDWTFEASMDGTNWTVLHTVTNASYVFSATQNGFFTNKNYYRYYRINITATYSGGNAHIYDFNLYEGLAVQGAGATGSETGTSALTAAPRTAQIDFGVGITRVITSYSMEVSQGFAASGDWTFEGSQNGSSWTTLDTKTSSPTGTYSIANTTAYRFYRLVLSAATSNPTAYYTTVSVSGWFEPGQCWFDTSNAVMYEWGTNNAWNPKQRVFVGQAVTDGTKVTSVVPYNRVTVPTEVFTNAQGTVTGQATGLVASLDIENAGTYSVYMYGGFGNSGGANGSTTSSVYITINDGSPIYLGAPSAISYSATGAWVGVLAVGDSLKLYGAHGPGTSPVMTVNYSIVRVR